MSSSRMVKVVVCVMLMCMVVSSNAAPPAQQPGVSCNQVVNSLNPCVSYVIGGGVVPVNCCNSVRGIWNMARTTSDRQGICTCLQSSLSTINLPPYCLALIAGLPAQCGVNIPYKISPSTNCKTLK